MKRSLLKKLNVIKQRKTLKKILVTGSQGQIGLSLLPVLSHVYGSENILATDLKKNMDHPKNIPYQDLDCLNESKFVNLSKEFNPCLIIHLSAILSGNAEKNVFKSIEVNSGTFLNSIKASMESKSKLFCPSSISSYGFDNYKDRRNVDDFTVQRPTTIYGVSKQ